MRVFHCNVLTAGKLDFHLLKDTLRAIVNVHVIASFKDLCRIPVCMCICCFLKAQKRSGTTHVQT